MSFQSELNKQHGSKRETDGSYIKTSVSMSSLQNEDQNKENKMQRPDFNSLKKKQTSEWRNSWGSTNSKNSSSSIYSNNTIALTSGTDDFWAALQTNYDYIMDTNLLDTCALINQESCKDIHTNIEKSSDLYRMFTIRSHENSLTNLVDLENWLNDKEIRMSQYPTLHEATQMPVIELQKLLSEHSVVYCEVISYARDVGACIKSCQDSADNEANKDPELKETNFKMLERRYHLLYLKAIEIQCLFESLLSKKSAKIDAAITTSDDAGTESNNELSLQFSALSKCGLKLYDNVDTISALRQLKNATIKEGGHLKKNLMNTKNAGSFIGRRRNKCKMYDFDADSESSEKNIRDKSKTKQIDKTCSCVKSSQSLDCTDSRSQEILDFTNYKSTAENDEDNKTSNETDLKESFVKQNGGIQKVQDWLDIQTVKEPTEEVIKVVVASDNESSEGLTDSMVTCLQKVASSSKLSSRDDQEISDVMKSSASTTKTQKPAIDTTSSLLGNKSSQDQCSEKNNAKKKKIKKRKQMLSTEKSPEKKHISDNFIITFNDDKIHDIENISLIAGFRNYMSNEQVLDKSEDHNSSFSETAWDNYQEKYNSENYSEGLDSDAARKLLECDDYRNFLDSLSDCCSSMSTSASNAKILSAINFENDSKYRNSEVSTEVTPKNLWDNTSHSKNDAINISNKYSTLNSSSDKTKEILSNKISKITVEEPTKPSFKDDKALWKKPLSNGLMSPLIYFISANAMVYKIREEILSLKTSFDNVGCKQIKEWHLQSETTLQEAINEINNDRIYLQACFNDILRLNRTIQSLATSFQYSYVDNLDILHCLPKFITDNQTILKSEFKEMYTIWENVNTRILKQLQALNKSLSTWNELESGLLELNKAMVKDKSILKKYEGHIKLGKSVSSELVQKIKSNSDSEYSQKVSESFYKDFSTGSLSDSGISDGDGCLSDRENRLTALRNLVNQLKETLAPNSTAMESISTRMEAAENELADLKQTFRKIVKEEQHIPKSVEQDNTKKSKSTQNKARFEYAIWAWRAKGISFLIHILISIVIMTGLLLQPDCCESFNSFSNSLAPQLKFIKGPPPT
ncbi:hypothetical protein ACFFRR_006947 [Megaselia abdita]